jgi:hypothetical protein
VPSNICTYQSQNHYVASSETATHNESKDCTGSLGVPVQLPHQIGAQYHAGFTSDYKLGSAVFEKVASDAHYDVCNKDASTNCSGQQYRLKTGIPKAADNHTAKPGNTPICKMKTKGSWKENPRNWVS